MIQSVKLSKLRLSASNVRTAPDESLQIEPFAADLEARGVLQNLLVTPVSRPRGTFEVFDGGRRWRALNMLVARGVINPDEYDVPVRVLKGDDAELTETSLAVSFHHMKLSPAEECRAFQHFLNGSTDIDAVAKRFGVTRRFIDGRLRLADLAEPIFSALANGELTLDMAKAYASTGSHERQLRVWQTYSSMVHYNADAIRRVIANDTMRANDPIALLVGVESYEAAGGAVDRDLFSNAGERWTNPEIAQTLAAAMMEAEAKRIGEERGLAWIRPVASHSTWDAARSLHRIALPVQPMSPAEAQRVDEIEQRMGELQQEMENDELTEEGYLEDWQVRETFSGTPQGGIVSPLLANVYLHELDEFMEEYRQRFDKGDQRSVPAEYWRLSGNMQYRWKKVRRLRSEGKADDPAVDQALREIEQIGERRASLRARDPFDQNFRRLRFVRYADDFLIGVIGSKDEAREVMATVKAFLTDTLCLEASEEKSRIAKASDGVRFLGYDVHTHTQRRTGKVVRNGRVSRPRMPSDVMQLSVPWDKVAQFCATRKYGDWSAFVGQHRPRLLHCSDVEIVMAYNAELRGFANYYALAWDVKKKLNKLSYIWQSSFGRTLANKHKCSVMQVFNRLRCRTGYQVSYQVKGTTKTVKLWKSSELSVGEIRYGTIDIVPSTARWGLNRTEFVERLNANRCELCGVQNTACEVHHVRKMADMKVAPLGRKMISARARKRIVLCRPCHVDLHAGRLPDRRRLQL